MSETDATTEEQVEPRHYVIRIKGHLAVRWSHWFEGMTLTRENNGETLIAGLVVDQAALHGLLRKVRDLGMPLISVIPLEPKETPEKPDVRDVNPYPTSHSSRTGGKD